MRITLSFLILVVLVLGAGGSASAALVGHWKLDEGSGTVAYDSSGNGNDGTLDGGPMFVDGQYGGALAFDNSRVAIPASDTLTADLFREPFSLSIWINPTRTGNEWQQVFRSLKGDGNANDTLFLNNDGRLSWRGRVGTAWAGGMCETVADVVPAGQWTHAAVVGDATTFRIYVNGTLTQESAFQTTDGTNTNYYIGGNPGGAGEAYAGMADDVAVFDHALTEREVQKAMAGIAPAELASNPHPEDEAVDVPRDVVLSWTAGEFAAAHDVYFGTSFDDVNEAGRDNPLNVLLSEGQAEPSYGPAGVLDFETIYYWRIDEVNTAPDNTIFKGEVWSFTTEPFAYPIETIVATSNGISDEGTGPENTVDGSGLDALDQHSTSIDDMWTAMPPDDEPLWIQYEFDRLYKLHEMLVWNYNVEFELLLGFGIKNATLEYSEDGEDWLSLGDVELNQATARTTYTYNTTVDLQGVAARFVRLAVNSGFGTRGQFGLSEVRFSYVPMRACEPQPADGAANVSVDSTLAWRAGRDAVSHEVYFGTDANELPLVDALDQAVFAPGALDFGTTYYWSIDEITDELWAGELWSFTTQEYALIDDFERYTDDIDAGEAIFDTWLDGWVNETGSTVGYLETPFAEKTIVYSGAQSMPLEYNNADSPWYSEATRIWDTPQDWTRNGADTLVLHVRGNPPVFRQRADESILMGSTGGDIWGTADAFRMAYKRLSGDGSIVARVDSLVNTAAWAKGGVMIRETLDPGSKHAMVVVTPGNGVALQHRPTTNQASLSVNQVDLMAPHWVQLTRTGDTLTAERSEDGITWVPITADAAASTLTISMADEIYIGLALVSNNAGAGPTAAEFSNIDTTGNVTGQWQTEDIGGGQLQSNNPEPLYVAIADSGGQVAVVTHEDPEATLTMTWQPWEIPFSALNSVNLSRVREMTIGLGNRANPTPGGTGLLYIDDVGFGSPVAP